MNQLLRQSTSIANQNGAFAPSRLSRRPPLSDSAPTHYLAAKDWHTVDGLFGIILEALIALFKMHSLPELTPRILVPFEALLDEHYANPSGSRLRDLVPEIRRFFTKLPFIDAFKIYDQKYKITQRQFIPPTFHEIRHVMNIAQVMAVKHRLKLVTLDGDETLYPDRRNFEDMHTAHYITTLMRNGVSVAVVTAAGYGYQISKYEERLKGLLDYWKRKKLAAETSARFFLFGGESNYLMQCGEDYHLHPVEEEKWVCHLSALMQQFFREVEEDSQASIDNSERTTSDVRRLLDLAAGQFEKACAELSLRCMVVRKERAVGLVPGGRQGRERYPTGSGMTSLKPEILEEVCYRVRAAIRAAEPPLQVPFCAFNGGRDVWVDVGNKAEGVRVLQSFLGVSPDQCLHIGDQFTASGNDIVTRDVTPTLWICNPEETKAVMRSLLRQMNHTELHPDDCEMDGVDTDFDEGSDLVVRGRGTPSSKES